MFYKDDNNIQVCQLGIGDVLVGNIEYKDIAPEECSGIVFGEIKRGEINRKLPELAGKRDCDANVKFKLLFTDVKSIDVVINALIETKRLMNGAYSG